VTAGITGATRVYLHLAHPSAHARTPQVMNAEFARAAAMRCVPDGLRGRCRDTLNCNPGCNWLAAAVAAHPDPLAPEEIHAIRLARENAAT